MFTQGGEHRLLDHEVPHNRGDNQTDQRQYAGTQYNSRFKSCYLHLRSPLRLRCHSCTQMPYRTAMHDNGADLHHFPKEIAVLNGLLILAGIACIGYGVTIMAASSGTSFFLVWYAMGIVLAGSGAAEIALPDHTAIKVIRMVVSVCAALGLVGTIVLSSIIMSSTYVTPPRNLDHLIVLGAQVKPDGAPANSLRFRLEAARDYLEENPDTQVIVSGGQGPNEPCAEADAMASWLVSAGINEQRIHREDASTDTVENLVFSKKIVGRDDASIGIVTNDFHLYRALRIAEKQGLRDVWGISAHSLPWYLPNNLLRECLAITKNTLIGEM